MTPDAAAPFDYAALAALDAALAEMSGDEPEGLHDAPEGVDA